MGLFHSGLKDIEAKLGKGDISGAKRIAGVIYNHVHASDFGLKTVNESMKILEEDLVKLASMDPKGDLKQYMDDVMHAKHMLEVVIQRLKVLLTDDLHLK